MRCLAIAAILLFLAACGEGASTPTPDDRAAAPGVSASTSRPERRPEPARAREQRARATTADLVAELREKDMEISYAAPKTDAAWATAVVDALARAAVEAPPHVRSVQLEGGVLDVVEASGSTLDAPWVHVERWQGDDERVLAERAAIYTTPVARAGFYVKRIDLGGATAYRSNLDDAERPTVAWRQGVLFVRVGGASPALATRVHEALQASDLYDVPGADAGPATGDPFGDEPFGDEPFGDKPFGDKPFGDEPSARARSGPRPSAPSLPGPDLEPSALPAPGSFERAVEEALRWLAAHQAPTGAWTAASFGTVCNGRVDVNSRSDGPGRAIYDVGVTGLALQAFLKAGYTSRGRHPFAKTVSRGLRFLKNVQDAEGFFGARTAQHAIYNHATASIAMVEAYGKTGSPIFRDSAQKALDFIEFARNPYFVWRYGVKPGDNDTSVTGWMLLALQSARRANEALARNGAAPNVLRVSGEAYEGIRTWINKTTDPDYGRTGYIQRGGLSARPAELIDRFPGERSEANTAVGVLARFALGEDPRSSDVLRKGIHLLEGLPPSWNPADGSIDMIYWHHGTIAMFRVGGPAWASWKQALQQSVVASQRTDTDYCGVRGSWDPAGPWGADGGRVMSTALLALCCQTATR